MVGYWLISEAHRTGGGGGGTGYILSPMGN